ncbi:DNA translocase FtsK [Candidatus Gracilibacteria bacterium]|nr:DNA translocase FtsK [Candidatus Gracilibacteria bacterium]
MSPRRKKTQKLSHEHKTYLFAGACICIGILTLITDTKSILGFYMFDALQTLFGEYYKVIFAPVLILLGSLLFYNKNLKLNGMRLFGLLFFLVSFTSLIGFFSDYPALFNVSESLEVFLGKSAVGFSFFILFILSLVMLFRFSPVELATQIMELGSSLSDGKTTKKEPISLKQNRSQQKIERMSAKQERELEKIREELQKEKESLAKAKRDRQMKLSEAPKKIAIEKKGGLFNKKTDTKKKQTQEVTEITRNPDFKNWELPDLELLVDITSDLHTDPAEIREKEIEIQEKLLQFKIEVDMLGYTVGPTVIQYRLKPQSGVKLQRIVNLKSDLTLALHAKNIRIQAPIPGLGAVGIEVPNPDRQAIGLKELLTSKAFNNKKHEIPIAIGKNVNGDAIIGDLTKMPHMLVAGQTGSGKSVGMNGFLVSMLYKFSPSELKMIMVDPKRVELSIYNGIPHLLTPVITNPDKALNALKWCVAEMLRRYDLETQLNVRNIKEYNAKVAKSERLPYIVMVIDELADLMMSGNKKEVESAIARIAQMARAVGIHMIIATQRPSVDVITGLIKANIPSRIAFTVASQVDSRTVIDKQGAEDLLGRGDMLYYPTGVTEPERVQGVLIETQEVQSVVNHLKRSIDPDMLKNMQDPEISNGKSKLVGSVMENYEGEQEEDPEIIEKAIQVVKQSQKGSTSLIQRKLGLGYARAAKILDILEELGVVGPANGSKPREVYVD